MIGYDYGNTRLRVRAGQMLVEEDYRGLLGATSLDGLLGKLAGGPYGPSIENALGRYRGLRRLDEAVRTHLSGQLADVLSFYGGEIRDRLRLFESRWDIRNLRTILRSLGRPANRDTGTAFLVAAGNLDDAALGEVVDQRDVRSAIDLLSVWQLPSTTVVRHLRRALPQFDQTGDITVLERALDESFGETVVDYIADRPPEDPLASVLQELVDRLNLTSVLRHAVARLERSAVDPFVPVPGGRVSDRIWDEVSNLDDRADVETSLVDRLPGPWRDALVAWVTHGQLSLLEHDLTAAAADAGVVRFRRGDPLGMDVPLGFIVRKETEAKNLRLVGRAVAHGLPIDEVSDRLVGVR